MLKTHIEESHTERVDASFSCSMCGDVFNSKWYFKNHIRDHHSQAKEICRHFKQGRCNFSEDECWSSHQETTNTKDKFECHTCKEMFNSKNVMMKHRKSTEPSNVISSSKEHAEIVTKIVGTCTITRIFNRQIKSKHPL